MTKACVTCTKEQVVLKTTQLPKCQDVKWNGSTMEN